MKHDWQNQAACQGADVNLFFGDADVNMKAELQVEAAKRLYCKSCPVTEQCLEDAIVHHEQFGVWGDTTLEERKGLPQWRQLAINCKECSAAFQRSRYTPYQQYCSVQCTWRSNQRVARKRERSEAVGYLPTVRFGSAA